MQRRQLFPMARCCNNSAHDRERSPPARTKGASKTLSNQSAPNAITWSMGRSETIHAPAVHDAVETPALPAVRDLFARRSSCAMPIPFVRRVYYPEFSQVQNQGAWSGRSVCLWWPRVRKLRRRAWLRAAARLPALRAGPQCGSGRPHPHSRNTRGRHHRC